MPMLKSQQQCSINVLIRPTSIESGLLFFSVAGGPGDQDLPEANVHCRGGCINAL